MKHLEEIQHLDFVPQLTCDRRANPTAVRCGKAATVMVTCLGCDLQALLCARCERFLKSLTKPVEHKCGAVGTLAETLRFVRVGGA